ncbi:MAG: ester cyclase [Aquamicrobium sp.]|uniref:ester cyclase n=1 Tax=Mesorhizobium sp. Pch-S TaxID=2082387 RepID=UPI0013EDC1B2|nr:ester cyclase [Mesorhizobium sp. Pch-S]MBR2688875.1 ester cyclase [Aquamicrobium sp.]
MTPNDARKRLLAFRSRLYVDHDLGAVDDYLHPEFESDSPLIASPGREAYRQFVRMLHEGLPDLCPVEQTILVEHDRMMAMTHWRATHTGPFLGVAGTGKTLTFKTADRYELRDRQLYRHWDVVDRLDASMAIGLLRPV